VEGGDAELVEALKRGAWTEIGNLTPRERALCGVADKLSRTATRMVEADWAPLRELGFDDQACLEVAHIVGIFNHLTRLADGLGLELDAATRQASETGSALVRRR
jgi:alkylhydroperoxidase family enzyme